MTSIAQKLFTPTRRHYLALVGLLVRRDLKIKYRGTVLGYLWSMLNPLLFMVIISLVFRNLVRGIDNYSIYVLAGILYWNMSSLAIVGGTGAMVGNGNLIQKIKIPLWVFPLVPLGTALANLALALIPYFAVCLYMRIDFTWHLALLPVVLLLSALFLTGITLGLSSLNVFFRDISHMLEPIMTLMFYATPIIYDRHSQSIPSEIAALLGLNPFVHYVEAFRSTILPQAHPISGSSLGFLALLSAGSLIAGGLIYKQAKGKIPLAV